MGRNKNKKIWMYFDRVSEFSARCKHCKVHLSCKHTSANLVRHLYHRHQVDASYYGAKNTGFLKNKLDKLNQEKSSSANNSLEHETLTEDNSYDRLQNIVKNEPADGHDSMEAHNFDEATEQQHRLHDDVTSLCEFKMVSQPQHEVFAADGGTIVPATAATSPTQICVESQNKKLKAEARYYNEMADLARSKRILVELETEKLRLEMYRIGSS